MYKKLIFIIGLAWFASGCIKESDLAPGCTPPPLPRVSKDSVVVKEGKSFELNGSEPGDLRGGTVYWEGPNDLHVLRTVTIYNVKKIHEGEYRAFYEDANKCKSGYVTVKVIVVP